MLGLKTNVGSLDINMGCSGFVYALSIAKGLIQSGAANNILIVTTDTYSKYIRHEDRSNRVIFGDGVCATPIRTEDVLKLKKFAFGTDGNGSDKLFIDPSEKAYDGEDDLALSGDFR